MQHLLPWLIGEADVNPGVVLLVNELVEGEIELADEIEKTAVLLTDVAARRLRAFDVCRLTAHVLAVLCSADRLVEFWGTIAARHDDRFSVSVAKRLEDALTELRKITKNTY